VRSVADRLPDRFPVGTRYVIEGRRAAGGGLHIYSRFVVYPDGSRVVLPSDHQAGPPTARRRRSKR
jgi:hypothetical protein